MQRFLASVVCLLGLSGCVYAGYDYVPPTEQESLHYVSPVVNRNVSQQTPSQPQQPFIVPQYVPVPQPYYVPAAGYGMPMQNPYTQQIAQQKMDTLSRNYTAHNLNVARETQSITNYDEDKPSPFILLRHPYTQEVVQCQRADYPCVYAYEDRGFKRYEPPKYTPPAVQREISVLPTYTNAIPRW